MLNVFSTVCTDDCTAVQYPAIAADQDCIAFEDYRSQIAGILFRHPDGVLPGGWDWTDRDDWTAIVDNGLADVNAAKYITGIGSMPAPEKTTRVAPKLKSKIVRRRFTLTFNVLNMSDLHYAFLSALQCGDTAPKVWFETVEGHVFGGEDGISLYSVDADMPLAEGDEDYEQGTIILVFDATGDPPRTTIENLSENFTTGGVTPSGVTVWGSDTTAVWGSSSTAIWGAG